MSISQNIARLGVRHISSSAVRASKAEIPQGYFELKKVQDKFQVKDGKPIFLKGGAFDSVMYRFTMGLSLVGLGGILKLIYDLSYPAKPE